MCILVFIISASETSSRKRSSISEAFTKDPLNPSTTASSRETSIETEAGDIRTYPEAVEAELSTSFLASEVAGGAGGPGKTITDGIVVATLGSAEASGIIGVAATVTSSVAGVGSMSKSKSTSSKNRNYK